MIIIITTKLKTENKIEIIILMKEKIIQKLPPCCFFLKKC